MAGKRRGWWLAGLLIAGAGATLWLRLRSEPSLLARSRRVVTAAQYGNGSYQWISDGELLIGREYAATGLDKPGCFRLNLKRTAPPQETNLRKLMPGANCAQFRVSPTGERLLSGVMEKGTGRASTSRYYYSCRLDGTRLTRHDVGKGFMGARWLADGRHWIELYGIHVVPARFRGRGMNLNSAPMQIQRLRVFDAESPVRSQTIAVPASALLAVLGIERRLTAISATRFLIWEPQSVAGRAQVVIQEIDAASATPLRRTVVPPPGDRGAIQLVFTPRGDRILWKLGRYMEANAFAQFLHRRIPAFRATGEQQVSLWISRTDGSRMHEIGVICHPVNIPMEMGGPVDPETGEHYWGPPVPRLLQWTPDGRRVSFTYQNAIWTAPAD